jgi:hypothetical protein
MKNFFNKVMSSKVTAIAVDVILVVASTITAYESGKDIVVKVIPAKK